MSTDLERGSRLAMILGYLVIGIGKGNMIGFKRETP
jgi:hypothetical protein